MTKNNLDTLDKNMLEFAKDDLKIAEFLINERYFYVSIYYLEQTFEKIIKSYYIFIEKRKTNNMETLNDKIINLSHDIDTSTISLLLIIGNFEKEQFQKKRTQIDDLTHLLNRIFYEKGDPLNNVINGYIDKLLNDITNLDKELQKNFVNNIKSYKTYILQLFNQYQQIIKSYSYKDKTSTYTQKFLRFMAVALILFQCLYKMNETTRYPLSDFNYHNIDYLNNKTASKKIKIMVEDLKNSYISIFDNYDLTRVAQY